MYFQKSSNTKRYLRLVFSTHRPAPLGAMGGWVRNGSGERDVPGVEAAEQRLGHARVHDQLLLHVRVALPREVRHGVRDEGGRVDPCLGSTYAMARKQGTASVRNKGRPARNPERRTKGNSHARETPARGKARACSSEC